MIHTRAKWFYNINLIDYWNNEFTYNTMGDFNPPYSTNKNFNGDTSIILEKLVEIAIIQITQASNASSIFKQVDWVWMEDFTKHDLRQAVMEQVQFMVNNRTIWEKINNSSIQTPNGFQINNDAQTYLLKADVLGMSTKKLIDSSQIKDYEWMTEQEYQTTNQAGIYVVGKIDIEKIKELQYD